ncbi:YtxH domain-containing protein [Chloroflexota bacterium]
MSEHSEGKNFILGLLTGAAIGVAVGLLYAPKSGSETRAILKDRLEHATEEAKHIVEIAQEKAKSIVSHAHDKAADIKADAQKEASS